MTKDTFYFSHDYNTRNDEKVKLLIRKFKMEGYGIFWAIVEDLYNNGNRLKVDYEGIAYDLRVDTNTVKCIIEDFGLFVFDGENFGSLSVQGRIDERLLRSNKARDNAYKRWNVQPQCDGIANAVLPEENGNAIKEKKEKKEKKERIEKKDIVMPFHSDKFRVTWQEWKDYKQKQHGFKYKSEQSEQSNLINLAELSCGIEEVAIKIINQSFINGWKGLFELKNQKNGNTKINSGSGHVTNEQLHESITKRFS